jgi:hypothetical protein
VRYNQVESRNSLAAPWNRILVMMYMKMQNFNYMVKTMTQISAGQLAIRCRDIYIYLPPPENRP